MASISGSTATVTDDGTTVTVTLSSVGAQGAAGPGVATGGSTGQVLVKASGTNYDTAWTSSPTFGTATMTLGTATTLQAGTATMAAASIGSVSNAEIQYLDGLTEPLTTSLAGKTDDADLPHHALITGIQPCSDTNSATYSYLAASIFNCYVITSTTVGRYLEWTVFVAAGTYTLRLIHRLSTDAGIVEISIDGGSALGTTIDTYAAANSSNNITDVTGIALAAGRHTIRFTGNSKNASSSGYRIGIQGFALTRTGA